MKRRVRCLRSWIRVSAWLGVLAVSILAVLVFWALLPERFRANESGDYFNFYEPVARSVLAGRGFTGPDGNPALRYPPGYPLCLAGVFGLARLTGIPEPWALNGFVALATALSSLLVLSVARGVWGVRGAPTAALLWSTYPPLLWLCRQPSSETAYLPVLYAGLALFCGLQAGRRSVPAGHWAVGAILGCAMLIRPSAIGLPLLLGSFLVMTDRKSRPVRTRLSLAGLLLLGTLTAILPWELWVWARTGSIIPLATGGPASVLDGLTFSVARRADREPLGVSPDVERVERTILEQAGTPRSLRDVAAALTAQVRERPRAAISLLSLKAARSWYGTDSHRFEEGVLAIQLVYLSLVAWAVARAWRLGESSRRFAVLALGLTLYTWGTTVAVLSIARYMVPAFGPLFVLVPALLARGSPHPHLVGRAPAQASQLPRPEKP